MISKLFLIGFIIISPFLHAKDGEPSEITNRIKFKALRLLRNDPIDNRTVQDAKIKFPGIFSRQIDFSGFKNCKRNRKSILPIILKEKHTKPYLPLFGIMWLMLLFFLILILKKHLLIIDN